MFCRCSPTLGGECFVLPGWQINAGCELPDAQWCETLSSGAIIVQSDGPHASTGETPFQKSKYPHASLPRPSEIHISIVKSCSNEEFSTANIIIFNADSNGLHFRFRIRT